LKYYILLGCLVAALGGVLLTGFVAAIPVMTRAFLFLVKPVEVGLAKGWHLNTGFNAGHLVSVLLFFGILFLGVFRRRFWCQYVCPSGAVFSLGNLFRATERKVETSCISCNKCVDICPFDAIKPDFTTRTAEHALPDLRRSLPHSCDQICGPMGLFQTQAQRSRKRATAFAPRVSTCGLAGVGVATTKYSRRRQCPSRAPAWKSAGRRISSGVHPIQECFQACPNDVLHVDSSKAWRVVDTASQRQLGWLRILLQQLRAGLPDWRDSRAAHGGDTSRTHGPGTR
jgi:ferredoxin